MKKYNHKIISCLTITTLLTACAPIDYTLETTPQMPNQETQWERYRSGTIDCNNQTIMSKQDCVLGVHTKTQPTQRSIDALKGYGVTTPEQYDAAITEANKHKDFASNKDSQPVDVWRNVANYLAVKKSTEKAGETVEQWVARAKANAEKERKEFSKKYPYTAELSCTFNGMKMDLITCFVPSNANSSGTELEMTNGGNYNMFQYMQIKKAGSGMTDKVLTIPLSKSFQIKAQNNSEIALLNLVVKKSSTNEIIFQQSARQFGVVAVQNP